MRVYVFILLSLFAISPGTLFSQEVDDIWQIITYEELKDFSLNNRISFYELITIDENWGLLEERLGKPEKIDKTEGFEELGIRPGRVFYYRDVEIDYSDDYTDDDNAVIFHHLTIAGPDAFLKYKGYTLHVNQPINILKELFPDAYAKRHDIPYDDSGDYFIQLSVPPTNIGISFRYHPGVNTIKKIEFFEINT